MIKLHGIGNLVMLVPAIRMLSSYFRGSKIDFLTFRTNEGVLEGMNEINCIHYLERESFKSLATSTYRSFMKLKNNDYDLVIDFEQFAYYSALLTSAIDAPYSIGFVNPTHHRHLAYNTIVSCIGNGHMRHTFTRLVRAAGMNGIGEINRRITLGQSHKREAESLLSYAGINGSDPVVIIQPGSSRNLISRRWPAENFARLADLLIKRHGTRIIFAGGTEEAGLVNEIMALMTHSSISTVGSLSIKGFAALIENACFVVSNDTAAAHVAAAMGTPVVGLYGPNTPTLYGPDGQAGDLVFYRDLPCSPCLDNTTRKISHCSDPVCMILITVEEVADAIRQRFFTPDEKLIHFTKQCQSPPPLFDEATKTGKAAE